VTFETVIYEKDGGLATVTLNRPQALNTYSLHMRDELFEVFSAIADDDEVRVMLLGGAGRAFCAGADLSEFGTAPSPTIARRVRYARDVWGVLHGLEIPKIAVLHGFVFGSGLELALFCDLRIAAEGTQLGFPEARLGMIPAAGGTQTLPRVIGQARALEMLLTGRRIKADEALSIGLVTSVVPADTVQQAGRALADDLLALPPAALRAILQAVHQGRDLPLADALRLEARLAAELRADAPPGPPPQAAE
jgi:enoyl-CoA hydratase/carnithine racemase